MTNVIKKGVNSREEAIFNCEIDYFLNLFKSKDQHNSNRFICKFIPWFLFLRSVNKKEDGSYESLSYYLSCDSKNYPISTSFSLRIVSQKTSDKDRVWCSNYTFESKCGKFL